MPPGSPNPDRCYFRPNKCLFSYPFSGRPRLQNPYPGVLITAMFNIGTGGAIPVVAPKGTGGGS